MNIKEERAKKAAYMREYMKRAPLYIQVKAELRKRRWEKQNEERVKEYHRKYYLDNKDKWLSKDKEAAKKRMKEYRQTPKSQGDRKARRAISRGAIVATLTWDEWLTILHSFKKTCAYCGSPNLELEQEHMTPLKRQGEHSKFNVVPSCRKCNLTKGQRTPEEWAKDILAAAKKSYLLIF